MKRIWPESPSACSPAFFPRTVVYAIMSGVFGVSVVPSSMAAIISQSQGFVGQPSLSNVVEFDRFDPARGTLQSVEWRLVLDIDGGTLTVDNDGNLPATVDVQLGAIGSLSSTDVALVDDSLQPILSGASAVRVSTGSTFTLAADNGDGMTFDPTMPDAETHEGSIAGDAASALVNSTALSDYLGTEMFELTVNIDQLLDFGGVGGVSGQFDPVTASPNVVLIYEYVPEPTTSLPVLLSLGVLIGITRRRKRNVSGD